MPQRRGEAGTSVHTARFIARPDHSGRRGGHSTGPHPPGPRCSQHKCLGQRVSMAQPPSPPCPSRQCCCGDSLKLNKNTLHEGALLRCGPCLWAATPHWAMDHSLAWDGTQHSAPAMSARATEAPRSLHWPWPPTAAASHQTALTRPRGNRQPSTVPSCHHPRPPAPRAGSSVPPAPRPSRTFSAHRRQHHDPSSPRSRPSPQPSRAQPCSTPPPGPSALRARAQPEPCVVSGPTRPLPG